MMNDVEKWWTIYKNYEQFTKMSIIFENFLKKMLNVKYGRFLLENDILIDGGPC